MQVFWFKEKALSIKDPQANGIVEYVHDTLNTMPRT